MQTFGLEEILTAISMVAACVVAFFRVEGRTNSNRERTEDVAKQLDRLEERLAKLEDRHDAVYAEVRAMLLAIQKSVSVVEGRLGGRYRED